MTKHKHKFKVGDRVVNKVTGTHGTVFHPYVVSTDDELSHLIFVKGDDGVDYELTTDWEFEGFKR